MTRKKSYRKPQVKELGHVAQLTKTPQNEHVIAHYVVNPQSSQPPIAGK